MWLRIYLCYMIIMSLVGIITMSFDKGRAINKGGRYSEKCLLSIAFFGGALGSWLGMYLFRHKTKHKKFVISLPLMVLMHGLIFYILLLYSGKWYNLIEVFR